ncbi:MAG: hypothetical protein EXR54_05210 [Dehalococcoidia bacterium]|nr:hypothetical protein [Dehalococcoidia bacterium]MSQ16952.1 hypothetical protein [Dehalococcoidia bacterium]
MAITLIRKPREDGSLRGLLTRLELRQRHELMLFIAGDAVLISMALQVAEMLAPGGWHTVAHGDSLAPLLILAWAVKIPLLLRHRLYFINLNYDSARELSVLIRAVTLSSLVLAGVVVAGQWFVPELLPKPGAALAMDYLMSLALLGGFHMAKRLTRGLQQA